MIEDGFAQSAAQWQNRATLSSPKQAGPFSRQQPAKNARSMKKDLTIMVVEDYDDTRLLLKKGLEGLGYSVVEACNGQEAVDIADRTRPDLILMDLDLPILDGIAATQCIRQKPELVSVPIVAVTAYPMSYSHVKAFARGCDEYMRKPIDMTELERIVARFLPTI